MSSVNLAQRDRPAPYSAASSQCGPQLSNTLLPELFRIVARWSDPRSGRNLRACCKSLKHAILPSDLVYAEACWRLHYRDFFSCWRWAILNNHVHIIHKFLPEASEWCMEYLLSLSAINNRAELVVLAINEMTARSQKDTSSVGQCVQSVLALACGAGCTEVVKVLLRHGARIHVRSPQGLDALDSAAQAGHADFVKLLLKAGAHVSNPEPLMFASGNGDVETAKLLLEAGAFADVNNQGPLFHAIYGEQMGMVELLLDFGAYPSERALLEALRNNFWGIVYALLGAGADVNARRGLVLRYAAYVGRCDAVSFLLSFGADFHVPNENGEPEEALWVALRRGHMDVVVLLLKAGADIQAREGKILLSAIDYGTGDVLKRLLEHGGKIDRVGGIALREAARYGNRVMMDLLLKAGADIHGGNDEILIDAAHLGHRDQVAIFLEAGADLHARDDEALVDAAKRGDRDMVKLLLEAGSNVHARGGMALHIAAGGGYSQVVKYLLQAGADPLALGR
ncbi:hypothetical protein HDV00_008823 [Rhizophlyctis rosea]|nr:hypothetical protein HDV00_008823 [Rhizophlyctis rosea]